MMATVQYGYRKCGTHARVFSQTCAHGNKKNKISQKKQKKWAEQKSEYMERRRANMKKRRPDGV